MTVNIWEEILAGNDVRQNLSTLRKQMKESQDKSEFLTAILNAGEPVLKLLCHEDAKVRKNIALLLGELGMQQFIGELYEAYERETQLFVKSAYLTALQNLDCRDYSKRLSNRLKELENKEAEPENLKHLQEEMRALTELLVTIVGVKAHRFTGWDENHEIILLTNRNFQNLTSQQLLELEPGAKAKVFGAGVMAKVGNLRWISQIRTYQELLFVIPGMQTCPLDPVKAAEVICGSELTAFLRRTHQGKEPFYFRAELKSRLEQEKRGTFLRKLTSSIEERSSRTLVNSTSHYEVEIRLIENKSGSLNLLLKLYTLPDQRFTYRGQVVSASMKPVNAALMVRLVKDYLREGGQVLDPFCGVGTLLIERHKAVAAASTYGIDRNEDAVIKARQNTERAGQLIHYINRDFFEFRHDYLFDEIITDMPFVTGNIRQAEMKSIYERFFKKSKEVLKPDGVILLYVHNKDFVKSLAPAAGYRIREEFEISKLEGSYVYVLESSR